MKSLLKRLFPIVWLKKAFLIYNRTRLATIDKLIYRRYVLADAELLHYREENPFLRMKIDLDSLSQRIRRGFSRWLNPNWVQDEYIVHFRRPVIIDAKTGWGIVGKRGLVYESLGFSRALHVRKPGLRRSKRRDRLEKVVSLRDTGEENYFHFFNDVMPKLLQLRDYGVDIAARHIVISLKLWERQYFQELRKHPPFAGLNWHIQSDCDVESADVIFCKPITHSEGYWKELVGKLRQPAIPASPTRVFIKRSRSSMRYLENEDVVIRLLKHHGFVVVDPGLLSFDEQLTVFAGVKEVIAIHGAGTANLSFSQFPVRLLEIFHAHPYLPFHYIMLTKIFHGQYQALAGRKGAESGSGGFVVDVDELTSYLEQK